MDFDNLFIDWESTATKSNTECDKATQLWALWPSNLNPVDSMASKSNYYFTYMHACMSLCSERYNPGPFGLLNPIDSMTSKFRICLQSTCRHARHYFISLQTYIMKKVTIVYLLLGFQTLSPLNVVAVMSEVLYWLRCSLQ